MKQRNDRGRQLHQQGSHFGGPVGNEAYGYQGQDRNEALRPGFGGGRGSEYAQAQGRNLAARDESYTGQNGQYGQGN